MKLRSMEEKISYRLFLMGFLGLLFTAALCIFVFHKAFTAQAWTSLEREADLVSAGYDLVQDPQQLSSFVTNDLRITLISQDGSVLFESATDQRHGAELLLADVLGLHYGSKQLCQKPCSCGKQPDPLHGCPLPAGREHPTDACEQKSLNRSMNNHPTRRDTGLHFFCQRSCPHAQCQHGSRKAFLFLHHFPSRFCQILKSCAERRR